MEENKLKNAQAQEESGAYGHALKLRESLGPEADDRVIYPDYYSGLFLEGEKLNVFTTKDEALYVRDLQERAQSREINIVTVKHSLNELYQAMDKVNEVMGAGAYGGLVHSAGIFTQDNCITLYLNELSELQISGLRQRLPDFEGFRFETAPQPPEPAAPPAEENGETRYNFGYAGYWALCAIRRLGDGNSPYFAPEVGMIVPAELAIIHFSNCIIMADKGPERFGYAKFITYGSYARAAFITFLGEGVFNRFDGVDGTNISLYATDPLIPGSVIRRYQGAQMTQGLLQSTNYTININGTTFYSQALASYASDNQTIGGTVCQGTLDRVAGMSLHSIDSSRSVFTPAAIISRGLTGEDNLIYFSRGY